MASSETPNGSPTGPERDAQPFLIFELGGRGYGLPVRLVREVVVSYSVCPLPDMPPLVQGMIDLRGRIVPIIDLAGRIGARPPGGCEEARIIVLETAAARGHRLCGFLAERVRLVCQIDASEIEPAPAIAGSGEGALGIAGVTRLSGALTLLLSGEGLFDGFPAQDLRPGR